MGQEDAENGADGIDGQAIDTAVDTLVAERDVDPEEVKAVLERVTDDGVVSWSALEDELAEASTIVSTPETRLELAGMALSDARDAAAPVADLAIVQSRLGTFTARLETIESAVSDLGTQLQELIERTDERDDLYLAARELHQLTAQANQLQGSADELSVEIEEFEGWLDDPERRYDELDADIDAFAASLGELRTELQELEDAVDSEAGGPTSDTASAWVEAALQHRALSLFLADLRAELTDLRTWDDRDGRDVDRWDGIETQIDDRSAEWQTLGSEIEDIAPSSWQNHHEDRFTAFEETLEEFEPPIDWGRVYTELDAHRPEFEQDF